AFGHALCAFDLLLGSGLEVAVIGDRYESETEALLKTIFSRYQPNRVVALGPPGGGGAAEIPLLEGRQLSGNRPAAYVCVDFTCEEPVTDAARLGVQLDSR
ncbi:MAG: thioredoxin domain-containing protein, partial [Acidobacteriota bacterium]